MFAMTSVEVAAVTAELAPRLVGGRIQRVWQPDPFTLVLAVQVDRDVVYPVFACPAGAPRLGEALGKPPLPEQPWALGQYLRAQATGARITSLASPVGERIVRLDFTGGALVAELLPRGGCLVALDDADVIRAAAGLPEGARGLVTGGPFTPLSPRPAREEPAPRFVTARAVEQAAQQVLAELHAAEALQARDRWLRTARQKLERLRDHLARDLVRLGEYEQFRLWGELLAAQWARLGLPRGATEARVVDWYQEDAPELVVPLDPKVDGQRNIDKLFQKYRKGRDGRVKVEARQFEVEVQLEALDALIASDPTPDAALAALRKMGLGPPRPPAPPGQKRPATPGRLPYRPFISRVGERILVGRGGVDNHALTFRIARGNDTWMHVRDAPGAHVVVPQPARGKAPHPETLLDAAALAVHHSDLRSEPVAEVSITARKHVRAIPGGPPGRVTVAAARTLTVTDVQERVERLYRAVAQGEVP
jgi:predicted ribosome quality control (RQC) complex YloA/Tae2 family protein